MMSSEKFISLYDYLGRPAGSALGKEVVEAASKLKIPMQIRHVRYAILKLREVRSPYA